MSGEPTERPLLVGKFLSPYVRRVGITLSHHGIAFDRLVLSAVDDRDARERYNPTGRVPALVLASGETLVESGAILDHLDEVAGTDPLVPRRGAERRHVLQQVAVATGTIDRLMTANAERRRPADGQMPDRLTQLQEQSLGGFDALERMMGGGDWFGEDMRQGDLTTAVALTFAHHIFPGLVDPARVPTLERMRLRCEATTPFLRCGID